MAITTEYQIQTVYDGDYGYDYDLVVTIGNNGNYWTSYPARLDARNKADAHKEAAEMVAALRAILLPGDEAVPDKVRPDATRVPEPGEPTHVSQTWCGKFFTIPPGQAHPRSQCGY